MFGRLAGWWGGRRRRAATGSGQGILQRAGWLCSNLAQRTEPGNVKRAQELELDRRGFILYVCAAINTLLLLLWLPETASMQGERHPARRFS